MKRNDREMVVTVHAATSWSIDLTLIEHPLESELRDESLGLSLGFRRRRHDRGPSLICRGTFLVVKDLFPYLTAAQGAPARQDKQGKLGAREFQRQTCQDCGRSFLDLGLTLTFSHHLLI